MNRNTMKFGAILCLVSVLSFTAWPIWKNLTIRHANAALQARTKALVDKNPSLKPAWNIAMQDGTLTWEEAKEIIEGAGEKLEPEK